MNYMEQYVDRMDEFLAALLSREALPPGATICRHCTKGIIAVWRCRDCSLGTPMCRACMRHSHRENPFHRIQQWNGGYFRSAGLWEVGSYLLVQHHTGESICETIKQCCDHLEKYEENRDRLEQEQHQIMQIPVPGPGPGSISNENFDDFDIDYPNVGEEDLDNGVDDYEDEEPEKDNPESADTGSGSGYPLSLGTDVRVVHTNGLHHITMINCLCRGEDYLPLDLFASQLLPASLKRIKTLFTAQVLDSFRLCNLELKASAYQFYQLLRRLTNPIAPGEVINLYREFRRMSRLWRWMKKLKWAGYAGSTKKVDEVGTGELAIYCPACPQPGINLPDDWKDDSAR